MNNQTNAIDTGGPPQWLPEAVEAVDGQSPIDAESIPAPALDGGAAPDWPAGALEGEAEARFSAGEAALDAGGPPRYLVDTVNAGALGAEPPTTGLAAAIDAGGPAAGLVQEVGSDH